MNVQDARSSSSVSRSPRSSPNTSPEQALAEKLHSITPQPHSLVSIITSEAPNQWLKKNWSEITIAANRAGATVSSTPLFDAPHCANRWEAVLTLSGPRRYGVAELARQLAQASRIPVLVQFTEGGKAERQNPRDEGKEGEGNTGGGNAGEGDAGGGRHRANAGGWAGGGEDARGGRDREQDAGGGRDGGRDTGRKRGSEDSEESQEKPRRHYDSVANWRDGNAKFASRIRVEVDEIAHTPMQLDIFVQYFDDTHLLASKGYVTITAQHVHVLQATVDNQFLPPVGTTTTTDTKNGQVNVGAIPHSLSAMMGWTRSHARAAPDNPPFLLKNVAAVGNSAPQRTSAWTISPTTAQVEGRASEQFIFDVGIEPSETRRSHDITCTVAYRVVQTRPEISLTTTTILMHEIFIPDLATSRSENPEIKIDGLLGSSTVSRVNALPRPVATGLETRVGTTPFGANIKRSLWRTIVKKAKRLLGHKEKVSEMMNSLCSLVIPLKDGKVKVHIKSLDSIPPAILVS